MARQPRWLFPSALALAAALSGGGCSNAPSDDDPVGALRLFLAAMDRSREDPTARQDAFRLLAEPSREALRRRARLATALAGGRDVSAHQLLVPGRFRLRFTPRASAGLVAQVQGDVATIVVRGREPDEHAELSMLLEEGHWRVVLELPDDAEAPPSPDAAPTTTAPTTTAPPSPDVAPTTAPPSPDVPPTTTPTAPTR